MCLLLQDEGGCNGCLRWQVTAVLNATTRVLPRVEHFSLSCLLLHARVRLHASA